MISNLLLIRHAETEFAGTFCGHLDPPLSPLGREHAFELVRSLATSTIDAVYSSDLQRASDTGTALAASKGLTCQTSARLREMHFGAWEGLDWASIERRDPDAAAHWIAAFPQLPAPGGEAFSVFEQRVVAEIEKICSHPKRSVAILTHAGVLRVLLQHLAKLTMEQTWESPFPFCCVLRLTRLGTSDRWSLLP